MIITFEGHACFQIEGSKKIIFDPFLSENPLAKTKPAEIKTDFILLSHAHGDHLGDTVQIAKNNDATVVCVNELGILLEKQGVKVHRMHIGGSFCFGDFKVKLTAAWHGSGLSDARGNLLYAGPACGFLVWLDEQCLYYAGDTGLFGDMEKVIGRNKIDVAFLPIGDNFTMGPEDALTAVTWLRPHTVIPMHYQTFPVIEQDAGKFKEEVESKTDAVCVILQPTESIQI